MFQALVWVHILCMVGCFGGLLALQLVVPAAVRNTPEVSKSASKLFNILIGIGLIAGVVNYVMDQGYKLGGHYNGVIGTKFMILLAVGALLGLSNKPGKGDAFRTASLVLLALAALFGTTLPHGG